MEENHIEVDSSQGKNNHNRNMVLIGLFVFIAIVVAIILTVLLNRNENNPKLTISNTDMSVTYNEYLGYSATIKGVAVNTSGRDLSYASVEFSVYDASGNNLGTALANINHLGKGDTWRFEATLFDFPSTRPSTYKLAEIIAYTF